MDPTSENSIPAAPGEESLATLSKSARKKALRSAHYEKYKLQRRAREKEARKEKKRIRAAKRAAGELDEQDEAEKARQKKKPKLEFGGNVVIDLGFDDLMSEKEIKSLCSQLAYTYSANRNASYPFSLIFTALNGRTMKRLDSINVAGYLRWSQTHWTTEGYEQLWQPPLKTEIEANDAPNDQDATVSSNSEDSLLLTKESMVYLTADADEELSELKPEETYIIGGIVDRNRYKNLCLKKAQESGIRTARLPIGRYLASLPTRKVLTVNQVFEILVKWVETKDWETALYSVMPKRKFQTNDKGGKAKEDDTVGEDREHMEGAVDEGDSGDEIKQGDREPSEDTSHGEQHSINPIAAIGVEHQIGETHIDKNTSANVSK